MDLKWTSNDGICMLHCWQTASNVLFTLWQKLYWWCSLPTGYGCGKAVMLIPIVCTLLWKIVFRLVIFSWHEVYWYHCREGCAGPCMRNRKCNKLSQCTDLLVNGMTEYKLVHNMMLTPALCVVRSDLHQHCAVHKLVLCGAFCPPCSCTRNDMENQVVYMLKGHWFDAMHPTPR